MIKWLKKKYNRWLFKKYGFNRGLFFERIPTIYKINPLWSPSYYSHWEGVQVCDWFRQGIEEVLHERKAP